MKKNTQRKRKVKKLRKAKGLESFRKKKVIIEQLSQLNIPKELRIQTLRHLSASVIQDKFNEKYLGRVKQILNQFTSTQLKNLKQSFDFFINSTTTSYEFDEKKIPGIILDIQPDIKRGSQAAKFLIDLKENQDKLKLLFKRVGYNNIIITINTMFSRLQMAVVSIQNFKSFAIDDYRASQLGIETEPGVRNTSTRRSDMITRPPKTERTRAITRRVRSR